MAPDVDPDTWRHVKLSMGKTNGARLDIELLRPTSWLNSIQAQVGSTIYLDLPEFSAVGDAHIAFIGPCPKLERGDGNVVTGTFRHESDGNLLRLFIDNDPLPIGVTSNHLFWSADRYAYVEAGALRTGERLDGAFGSVRVSHV